MMTDESVAELVRAYWAETSEALGLDGDVPEAWSFGGGPQQADHLLSLVLAGTKAATSSSYWAYEAEGEPLPAAGQLSILCDARGLPRAVLRVTGVSVVAFDEASSDHALAEGEGDRTLTSWREVHEAFFRAHLPPGRQFSSGMPVVLERFEVLAP